MAKKKHQKKTTTPEKKIVGKKLGLSSTSQILLALGIVLIIVLVYFSPLIFENKVPPSTDIIAWKGNAQTILDARKELHTTPLWANNVFSGMPSHLISLRPPFEQPARYIIEGLSKILKWQPIYYLLGAAGMMLLLLLWKLNIGAALFASLAFIWWPDLIGKLEAGHNSKVQTIMCIPIIVYLFLRLMKKANILNLSLFTIAFSIAVRAGHYQIVFYAALAMAFFGVVHIVKMVIEKQIGGAAIKIGLVVIGLLLGTAMSAFSTIQVREYSKYSIRGGTGEKGSSGLDFDYATQWSLHPGEMYNFIIPRFWGGHSSQVYNGDAVPQLKGRTIPGYWGHMPFTSTTDYLGVVAVFFAIIGMVLGWRRTEVKILVALLVFSALLAFGRHFPPLYKFLFNVVPFFDKFRIPSMAVVLIVFSNAALAGVGIHELVERGKELDAKSVLKKIGIIFGVFILLGVIPILMRNSLSFTHPGDVRYGEQVATLLKTVRFDLLRGDAIRMLALVAGAFALVAVFVKNWLSKSIFIGAVVILLLVDLIPVDKRYMTQLIPQSQMDAYFTKTNIDQLLMNDNEPHRIYPIGELSGQAHWSYYHQSIEGYHPAKLRIYQDIRESCLLQGLDPDFGNDQAPINWNVVNMLNAKYVLAQGAINHPNLIPIHQDAAQKIVVYKNSAALPRAFCVGRTEIIADRKERFARLNQASFQPDSIAIIEKEMSESIIAPQSWDTEITRYEPNKIDIKVTSDARTLMILSEIYYPAGWRAFIGDKELEIFKTNHILRGVIVPAGTSTVNFKLEPESFKISTAMMGGSIAIVYILLILGLVPVVRRKIVRDEKEAV
jgi:hypothetical protein